ncbi:MAG: TPM domain-containing protein [Rubrivivax sp.]|nr:TPM domain-containing protein [Rubrivivax sp.]
MRAPAPFLAAAWLLGAALLLCAASPARAQLPVPELSGRVIDQTGTLSAAQRGAVEAKLAAFEAQAGPQIVVLLVPTTAPEDIAAYAQRVADHWKIGRRDQGDGLLLVVAKNDRRVRIEVAKALEGAIPDLAARQIIDNAIRPAFRADDYAGGIHAALDQLMARIRGEGLPAPAPLPTRDGAQPGLQLEEIAMFLFVAVPILATVLTSLFGRKLGSLLAAGGAGATAWWFTASAWLAGGVALVALVLVGIIGFGAAGRRIARAGRRGGLPHVGGWDGGGWGGGGWSGGGGGSGGGFSSGGGGDFGGGGASGDW